MKVIYETTKLKKGADDTKAPAPTMYKSEKHARPIIGRWWLGCRDTA